MNSALLFFGLICILSVPGAVTESDGIACPKQVNGKVHEIVSIKCYYSVIPAVNKYSRKYFCLQGSEPGRCKHNVAIDSGNRANQFVDRITLVDNKKDGYFIVTINGLEKDDKGTYVCGIGKDDGGIKSVLDLSIVEVSGRCVNTEPRRIQSPQ